MPPKVDQGTIIILDIGRNVGSSEEKTKKSFYEEARECTSRLIERKIMCQGKNLLGVLLLGSKKTKNSMNEQCPEAFRRIELLTELQPPTWQMIRDLPEKASNNQGDWLEALVAAADHFRNGISGVNITNKKVVLMTNFQAQTGLESSDIDQIINGFKCDDGLEVDVIGPDIYDENQKGNDFDLARQFVESTNGATAPFEDTMRYLLFHRKKIVKPMPWNVDLSIGPNIKIPVSAYVRLRDEPVVKNWRKAVKDPVSFKASASEGIMREKVHINTENKLVVEPTDIIKGYNYGQQIIPFNECDKTMLYDSGEKCLSVYGFTHATNINWQNLAGDGLMYVFGRKGSKKAQNAIRCLVECLHEQKLVGVVRRVYNKGNAPKMFALMPVIDTNNYVCLSMAALCYKEEIKHMAFPPTSQKKYSCTDEQVNAFKDLIKAMDLTKAYDETFDETEAFPIAETVSPSAQYVLDCIAYRAMNPGKPLPQPRDDIMMLFKEPPLIEKRSREPLDKIKKLFPLNKVEVKKTRNRRKDDAQFDNIPMKPLDEPSTFKQANGDQDSSILKIQLPKKSDEVDRIGTIDPVNDYKILTEKGKSAADLSADMTEAIENLIYYNLDGEYSKGLNAMKFFRSECVKTEPSHYNDWLQKFKQALNDRKKHDVIALINQQQVGFILKIENSLSSYDNENTHEDSQLYENDTLPNSTELTIRSEVNDMFDEM